MHSTNGRCRVEVAPASSADAARWERELLDAGFRLPFLHRTASAELEPPPGPLFFMIRNASGVPRGGFAAQRRPSQALPGHVLLRAERFGAALADHDARAAAVQAFADAARSTPRVLRAYLGIFSSDAGVRDEVAALAAAAGFRRNPDGRGYSHTVLVDLRPDEDTIFASLHSTARRHVRAAAKHPVAVRPVDDPAFAPRLEALVEEAFRRTGGDFDRQDWPALIRFSMRHPDLSRLIGLFHTERTGPESLLAFAHGLHHGEYAEYSTAAASRDSDVRLPQMYVLAWDLFRWAKQHGAASFDFGGITPVVNDGSDPLQGISAFKRFFSRTELTVGDEWVLEPSPIRAQLARVVTSVARSVARS